MVTFTKSKVFDENYDLIGIDNFSKYGKVEREHSSNNNFQLFEGDVKDSDLMYEIMDFCDYLIAGAAMIGGISYFQDLLMICFLKTKKIIS